MTRKIPIGYVVASILFGLSGTGMVAEGIMYSNETEEYRNLRRRELEENEGRGRGRRNEDEIHNDVLTLDEDMEGSSSTYTLTR